AATDPTGVATKVISASGSSPTSSRAPSSTARVARDSSRSRPVTRQPCALRASPIEPPIKPVPTTSALRSELIVQTLRVLQVHVAQVVEHPLGAEVHQHPHAARRRPFDVELARAQEGKVAETQCPCCRSR